MDGRTMTRPPFDTMTDQEMRQNQACRNEFLGQQLAAQKRRKQIRTETDKLEQGEEK